MRTKLILCLLVVASFCSCDKDKFSTKPKLTLTSLEGGDLRSPADVAKLTIQCTDEEGDVDSTIFYRRINLRNCTIRPSDTSVKFQRLPDFDRNSFLDVNFVFNFVRGANTTTQIDIGQKACTGTGSSDSLQMLFWIKDKARNVSDTLKVTGIRVF
jgi:hypothetical protein